MMMVTSAWRRVLTGDGGPAVSPVSVSSPGDAPRMLPPRISHHMCQHTQASSNPPARVRPRMASS